MLSLDALVTDDLQGPSLLDLKAILKLLSQGTTGSLDATYLHSLDSLRRWIGEDVEPSEDFEGVKIIVTDGGDTIGGWRAVGGKAYCFVFHREEGPRNVREPVGTLRVGEMLWFDGQWLAEKVVVLDLPRDRVLVEDGGYGLSQCMLNADDVDDQVYEEHMDVLNEWSLIVGRVLQMEDARESVERMFDVLDHAVQEHLSGRKKPVFVACESQAMVEDVGSDLTDLFADDRVLVTRDGDEHTALWRRAPQDFVDVYAVVVGQKTHVSPELLEIAQVFFVVTEDLEVTS